LTESSESRLIEIRKKIMQSLESKGSIQHLTAFYGDDPESKIGLELDRDGGVVVRSPDEKRPPKVECKRHEGTFSFQISLKDVESSGNLDLDQIIVNRAAEHISRKENSRLAEALNELSEKVFEGKVGFTEAEDWIKNNTSQSPDHILVDPGNQNIFESVGSKSSFRQTKYPSHMGTIHNAEVSFSHGCRKHVALTYRRDKVRFVREDLRIEFDWDEDPSSLRIDEKYIVEAHPQALAKIESVNS